MPVKHTTRAALMAVALAGLTAISSAMPAEARGWRRHGGAGLALGIGALVVGSILAHRHYRHRYYNTYYAPTYGYYSYGGPRYYGGRHRGYHRHWH